MSGKKCQTPIAGNRPFGCFARFGSDTYFPHDPKWKELTSRTLKSVLRERFPDDWSQIDSSEPIWQSRYYGFNIWSRAKVEEKLDDMHLNPVRAGLVQRANDCPWSLARWYLERRSVGLPIHWPPGREHDDQFAAHL